MSSNVKSSKGIYELCKWQETEYIWLKEVLIRQGVFMYKKYVSKWDERRHAKDPNHFKYARLKIYAPEESDLHEITLTYIKKLDNNGAWDFDLQHIDDENLNIITFKWNGTVCALDAIAELHFNCEHTIKSEWGIEP